MKRADGYTDEQVKAWCICGTGWEIGSLADNPRQECPLHGGFVVEWQVFLPSGEAMGTEARSDEFLDDDPLRYALESIEGGELSSIRRTEDLNAYLQYRLLTPWHGANA